MIEIKNKKAYFDYFIEEEYECGIVLTGTEIKSIRKGSTNLKDTYATNINKITGKKINITECNTKDYIIINKDKTYSMNLTNNNCISNYYEGTIIIKNNEIIFTKEIK